jgi:SagB-type dehydrogenase family enzyme
MLDASDPRSLAFLFHLNSEPWIMEAGVKAPDAPSSATVRGAESQVELPEPGGDLLALIRRRSSCRAFAARSLTLADLTDLLAGAYGFVRHDQVDTGLLLGLRGVPSAGALYPLELYLWLRRVETLEDGLYHYDARAHTLERLGEIDGAALAGAFIAPEPFEQANAVVLVSAVFDRTLHKYGPRGYRYVLIEAGHVAQSMCLLAAERSLATLCVGGFSDSVVNRTLGIDPRTEGVVYCIAVGHALAEP